MDPTTPNDRRLIDHPPIDQLSCEAIRARLRQSGYRVTRFDELDSPDPRKPLRRAAVLLALYRHAEAWHLIFIRRAEQDQDRHSGEVGFPGGRWQVADPSCTATALREAEEEIGLPRSQVELLGELRPLSTLSQFLVTPVVGCVRWPQTLKPEPREVARIFSIPLAWLVQPDRHRLLTYPAPDHPEARELVFFDEFDGERLWGISARITLDLLGCLARTRG